MFKAVTITILLFFSGLSQASFILGEDNSKWGLDVTPGEDSPIKLKLGTRLHTVASQSYKSDINSKKDISYQDFYLRRGRFQVEAKYKEGIKFYMDVRNDSVNTGDSGEGDFNVGDAYIEVPDVFGVEGLRFRAFRAKVDVSRSETISSSKLLFLDRAHIADEAANYVNHNRRATNVQFQGVFDRWYFQIVAGDGVQKSKFDDAKGNSLSSGSIERQKFMVGGKVRFYPFTDWGDKKPTETYFGKGYHMSFGYGVFHTASIQYENSGGTQIDSVSRTLRNGEFSFHVENFSFQAEYFRFEGVVEDFTVATKNEGTGEGHYFHAEYVFPRLSYIAPFIRYEFWDKFKEKRDYKLLSRVAGVNWYLKGNKIRVGIAYQVDEYDSNLFTTNSRGQTFEDDNQFKITTMWHY